MTWWRSIWTTAWLLLAVSDSALVSISDVSPPRSILNGLESLVDVETLDDLRILRHSTTNAHIAPPESYGNANEFYGGPHQFKRILQPRFEVHSMKSGFILTAATPGLRRDEMSIEVVDDSGGHALNIRCKQCHNTTSETGSGIFPYALGGWQNCWSRDFPVTTVLPLRPPRRDHKYLDFKHRIPIPNCYNMSSLLARYEDGLLVVSTTPLAEKDIGRLETAVRALPSL